MITINDQIKLIERGVFTAESFLEKITLFFVVAPSSGLHNEIADTSTPYKL